MIDIHCHILPGVDDGSKDLSESLEMARLSSGDGVRKIVATPHVYDGGRDITPVEIAEKVEELNIELKRNNIGLEIVPGAEISATCDIEKGLSSGAFQLLGEGGRYILIEPPFEILPSHIKQVVFDLLIKGITPIIAHPERNRQIMSDPNILADLVEGGALAQVNAGSLTGRFGSGAKRTAEILVTHNMIHFIGSDGHSSKYRTPRIQDGVKAIESLIGSDRAREISSLNPEAMLNGERIRMREPIPYVKKRKPDFKKVFSFFLGRR